MTAAAERLRRHRPPAGEGDGVGRVPGRAPRRGPRHRHPDDHRPPRRQRPARACSTRSSRRRGASASRCAPAVSAPRGSPPRCRTRARVKEILGIPDDMTEIVAVSRSPGRRAPTSTARRVTPLGRSPTSTASALTSERGPSDELALRGRTRRAIAEVDIAAPPPSVWPLVTDINLPARFSNEFVGAEWDERRARRRRHVPRAQPAPGRRRVDDPVLRRRLRRTARLRLAHLRPRQPGRALALRPRAPRRRHPAAVHATSWDRDRPGTTMAITNNPGKEAAGPAPPPRRGPRPTCSAPSRAIKQLAEAGAMTLRVGVGAAPVRPEVGRVRPRGRAARRRLGVGAASSGPATRSRRSRTSPPHTSTIRLATGIVQLGARTPAMLAMSALSLQALSGGRFVLGIGTSGPQVMEGWHGVRFDRPVRRTRETIEIIRTITAGERLEYHGEMSTTAAARRRRAGRSAPSCRRRTSRSTSPSLGPANLRLTGELADGWIGNSFFPETADVFLDPIRAGRRGRGRARSPTSTSPSRSASSSPTTSRAAGRRHAEGYAFTFGAMGSATTNFYNNAFERQGYGDDVREVQRSGSPATRTPPASGCPPRSGSAPT